MALNNLCYTLRVDNNPTSNLLMTSYMSPTLSMWTTWSHAFNSFSSGNNLLMNSSSFYHLLTQIRAVFSAQTNVTPPPKWQCFKDKNRSISVFGWVLKTAANSLMNIKAVLKVHNYSFKTIQTSVACALGPSVTTSSTEFSFQNLVFWNLFEFSVPKITKNLISPRFWIQILPNKFY